MLESAFTDVLGQRFEDRVDSYITRDLALIKPHGSVNWAQFLPGEIGPLNEKSHGHGTRNIRTHNLSTDHLISAAQDLDFSNGEIGFRTWNNGGTIFSQRWHPAIAIPVDRTKTFVCPPDHLERLSHDLEWVTRILIIGWRATEKHFLDMLHDRLPKNRPLSLCVVDKDQGVAATSRNLAEALRNVIAFHPIEAHKEGFSEFVRQGKVIEWLAKPLQRF